MHNAYRKTSSYLIPRNKLGRKINLNPRKKGALATEEEEIRGRRRADEMNSHALKLLTDPSWEGEKSRGREKPRSPIYILLDEW